MLVVDASVGVKWFLPEAGSDEAADLLRGTQQLFAPRLIRLEVLSAITRQHRLGNLKEDKARRACEAWYALMDSDALSIMPDEPLLDGALALAFRLNHAFLDCLYLATAKSLDMPLLTADNTFFERASRHYKATRLLRSRKAS
jgi:predicted nucleic acid-binding protein